MFAPRARIDFPSLFLLHRPPQVHLIICTHGDAMKAGDLQDVGLVMGLVSQDFLSMVCMRTS